MSAEPDLAGRARDVRFRPMTIPDVGLVAAVVGGKGGGKPDNARGGGRDAAKLEEALAMVRTLI